MRAEEMTPLRHSLKLRLFGPLVGAAIVVSIAIAGMSYLHGSRIAEQQLDDRFDQLAQVLTSPSYPLNANVLDLLAALTDTQLASIDSNGGILHSTLESLDPPLVEDTIINSAGRDFRTKLIRLADPGGRADRVHQIAVLFELRRLTEQRRQAAVLPLLTGIATVVLLTGIGVVLASRIVRRIVGLQSRFFEIAAGKFSPGDALKSHPNDELGNLASSLEQMATELDALWKQVNQQQKEKAIHQIAAGMAHQLRNSLTGARMAIELQAREAEASENFGVALEQLEQSENCVSQLLMVASGRLANAVEMPVKACFEQLQAMLSPVARHLRKQIYWNLPADLEGTFVAEGATLIAAVSNLVQNAIQAGSTVWVDVQLTDTRLKVTVSDDGPGIDPDMTEDIFEPFVTEKPEGIGLGLAVVQRAARALGGRISHRRRTDRTQFEFECRIQS